MASNQVTVLARFKAKPGMEQQVAEALMALVGPTRKEAGCINYDLHQSFDDKTLFVLYENWTRKKDLDEHLEMPYLRAFLGKADDILAQPVEITLWGMITQVEK
jgi:quinol monooxygenase YgiN